MATTTTPALTAIATIPNVENLFVFVLLESLTREVDVTFCATSVETTAVVAVGPIDELELIELTGKIVIFGTKEGVA